jgi:hypothetical protein
VLGHLAHPRFASPEHPDLMQIAMETSANEHIEEPLPSPILWSHFERLGLRAGQSTIERYEKLRAARAEGHEPRLAPGTRPVDGHGWTEKPQPPPGAIETTRQRISLARDEVEKDPDAPRLVKTRIAGRSPDQLLLELVGTTDRPDTHVDWRALLPTIVARGRAPSHTWSRPSRRFPGRVGEIPGRTYQPRTGERPTLLVAIDTSLSMSDGELAEIARQLRPIAELARVVVVECDADIARVYPFQGAIRSVKGRGGTDLRPVFEPSFLRSQGADAVVFFTDGQGPTPERPPPIPVLWALTKPTAFECRWGDRAQLEIQPRSRRPG